MLQLYKKIQRKGFQDDEHSLTFLSFVYGADSPIIQYYLDMRAFRSKSAQASHQDSNTDAARPSTASNLVSSNKSQRKIESAHDDYWKAAQILLVQSKAW